MGKQVKGWAPPEDAIQVSEQTTGKSAWTPPSDAVEVKKKSGTQSPPETGQKTTNLPSGIGLVPNPGDPFGVGETVVKQLYQGFGDQIPKAFAQAVEVGISAMQPANTDEFIKKQAHVDFQKYVRERDPEFIGSGSLFDRAKGLITPFDIDKYLPKYKDQFIKEKGLTDVQRAIEEESPKIVNRRLAVEKFVQKQNKESEETLRGIAQSYRDVRNPGDALRYATNMATQGLWQIPLTIATRGLSGLAMESSAVYDNQLEQIVENHNAQKPNDPIDREEAIKRKLDKPAEGQFYAVAAAGLDYVSAGGLLSMVKGGGSNFVKNALAVTTETLTEPTQGMLEEMGGVSGAGGDVGEAFKDAWTKNISRRIDEAAGGFFGSGAVTIAGNTISGEKQTQQPDEKLQEQPGEAGGEGAIQQYATQENIQAQTQEEITPEAVEETPIDTEVIQELAAIDDSTQPKAEVQARRTAIKETIHEIAKEAGINIDTKEFRKLSKEITGKSHLDKMNTSNLALMLDYVQGEKEFSEGTNLLNQYEKERQEEGLLSPEKPEVVAGESTAIVETPKQQDYGSSIKAQNNRGEKTEKVKSPKTGEAKVSPVKKLSPVSEDVKNVVRAYDTEARSPSISEVDKQISAELSNTKISGESVNRFGDRSLVTPSMAKQYITGQGKGTTLDQIASKVSESLGQEVSPQEVWDFMVKYPQGPRTISAPSGNAILKELSDKYSDLTGKAINQKIARDMMARPDFYKGIADNIENSELEEYQKNALESTIYESGLDEVSLKNEDKVLDEIINDYTTNGKVDWKKLQSDIDDVLGTGNKKITQLTNELYGKLKERTESGIQQGDSESNVVEQSEGVEQRGLAERIKSQVRSLRSAKTRAEKVKIAQQILKDTGTYLLNREGVITGTDASFADKTSPTFFDLIDEGKSVYLLDKTSKIAQTKEDYQKINAKLKDKVTIVSGSLMFDEAFSNGAIKVAKDLGYDAIRLTEIDGTNSTLQVLNFDKVTHISGEDFVAKIQKTKDEKANDLLAEGFSELADVVGAKKNISGNQAKLNDALVKIGKGLILKGEATIENVIEKIKELLKSKGITVSDEQLKSIKAEIKKQTAPKKKKKKRAKKAIPKKKSVFKHVDFARAEIIKTFGENYIPQSNEETKNLTDDFIKKMGGLDEAFAAKDLVHPAVKAILYAEKLDSLRNEMDTNKDAMAEYMQYMNELEVMSREGGQAIQILDYIYQNYGMMFTAETQIKKFKEANNGHIPAEMAAKFKELEKKHEELEEKVKKLQSEKDEMQGKIDMLNIKQANRREGNIRKQKAQEMIRDAQEERSKLWKELTKLSSARAEIIPVTAISYGVKIANTYIKEGFARGVIGIDEVMSKTKDFWKKATGKDLTEDELSAIRKEVEPTLTFGNIKIGHDWIKELVQKGFDTIEKLVPEVMKELKKQYPEITERQVRDLITGYGKIINPSRDELNTQIRKIKRMGRIKSAIEDLKGKKRPLKSGLQRDKPDTKERGYMREIRELLKDVPVDEVTESNQLKTALDAKKTRLKNRIDDLNDALAKGKKIENKEQKLTDEEIEELTAIRDFNQAIYDDVFKNEKTDQRIDRLIKGYETAIEKLRYRIENLGQELVTARKDEIKDPIVKEMKERFDNLLKFYNDMREDSGIAELDRLDNLISNAEKITKKYEEKLKNGDFSRREMKPSYLGVETGVYQAQLDELKERFKYAENKTEAQKEIDTLTKFIAKIEELKKVQTEREHVRDEFIKEQLKNELDNREKWEKNLEAFLDAASIPRQLNAGFEFSSVFIQGRTYTLHFLKEDILSAAKQLLTGKKQEYYTIKNFENMFKSFWTQKAHDLNIDKLKSNEAWKRAKQSKLAVHDRDVKMEAREEMWTSRVLGTLLDKLAVPMRWLGFEKAAKKWTDTNISRKFERAAQMYLNSVRFQRYLQLEEKIRKEGKNFISNPDDYKQAASAINTLSGATNVGPFEGKLMKWAPLFFYSFRMLASVLKQVSPLAFVHIASLHAKGDPKMKLSVAQKAAMSDFAISVGLQAMLMISFAAMMQGMSGDDDDWTVELDPRSSKFMQIRVKGKDGHVTYIDAWGGLRTAIVLQMRLLSGEVKNRKGELKGLGSRNVPTGEDLVTDYLINKASPLMQPIWYRLARKEKKDKRTGETVYTDKYGNEFAFQNEVAEKLYPMYFNSIYEMKDTQSTEMSTFGALIGLFGVNTNTYDESPKKK